jgi:hypothetical protein
MGNNSAPVKVFNPYGDPETIDSSELEDALGMGYKLATPEQVRDAALKTQYGGALEGAKAFGEGVGSGLTFGASTWLERLADAGNAKTWEEAIQHVPEGMAARAKFHPVARGAGNVVGAALPALLSAGATAPEEAGAAAAGELGTQATGAELASFAPTSLVSSAGRAVTEAAEPIAEQAAGVVANPATHPILNQILARAAASGAGSAVEGAAYGLGRSVDESALGDPDAMGEKLLSNVGYSALFAGSLGTLFGAGSGAKNALAARGESAAEVTPAQALEEAGLSTAPPPTDLEQTARFGAPGTPSGQSTLRDSVEFGELAPESQKGILDGLSELKPNASEIEDAARRLDAPLPEGLLSDSEHIQKIEDMLRNSPTPVGIERAALYKRGYERATGAVTDALGAGEDMTAAEAGNRLKQVVSDAFERKAGPVKDLYNQIEEYAPAVPVSDASTGAISKNIRKIIDEQSLIQGTPEHAFVNTFADGLDQVENLAQLKNFRTALNRATSPETRFVSGLIKEKLDNLEQNAIRRFAGTMKTPEAQQKILGLLDQIDRAKAGYSSLRDDMGRLGKTVLGRSKIYGPEDFLNAVEDQTPERFAKRLFAKDNSEFLQWLDREMPEATDVISQYQRSAIRDAATTNGAIDPKKIFKALDKLSPEVKKVLFDPEELDRIDAARTYLEAFPKNFNPSGTSSMEAYRRFFEHPITSLGTWAVNKAALGLVKASVQVEGSKISGLAVLERIGGQTANQVTKGAKALFRFSGDVVPPVVAYAAASKADKKAKLEERVADIHEYANDPAKLIQDLDAKTKDLYAIAPEITGSFHQTMARAVQVLAAQLPQQAMNAPLAPKSKLSDMEASQFQRFHDLIEDPVSLLGRVKDGRVTSDEVAAIRTVYPKLFASMQSAVLEELTNHAGKKKSVPYSTRLALGTFLGQDLDGSLSPQSLIANQQTLATPGLQQAGNQAQNNLKVSQSGLGHLSASERALTPMQASSQRTGEG